MAKRKFWHEATDDELHARVCWLESELSCALALLKTREQTPISAEFIEKTDALRRAGPDHPAWVHRHGTAH